MAALACQHVKADGIAFCQQLLSTLQEFAPLMCRHQSAALQREHAHIQLHIWRAPDAHGSLQAEHSFTRRSHQRCSSQTTCTAAAAVQNYRQREEKGWQRATHYSCCAKGCWEIVQAT